LLRHVHFRGHEDDDVQAPKIQTETGMIYTLAGILLVVA